MGAYLSNVLWDAVDGALLADTGARLNGSEQERLLARARIRLV